MTVDVCPSKIRIEVKARGESACRPSLESPDFWDLMLSISSFKRAIESAGGAARSAKLEAVKRGFSIYGNSVEVVAMDDLIHGQYPDAFKDAGALIHIAAPLIGREATPKAALDVSVLGSLNIIKQAEKAGIKTIGYVSSIFAASTALLQGDFTPVNENQWLPITREDVLNNKDVDGATVYIAEKALSERAVWDFVDQHPHLEVTTVNPPFFYGPFAPGYRAPYLGDPFSSNNLSTLAILWNLIHPKGPIASPYFVDVRDVARALVASLNSPSTAQVGRKRILMTSEWVQPSEIAALVKQHRPELASRVCEAMQEPITGLTNITDNKRLKEVLGLEPTPWRKTILDGVDTLVAVENAWKARGVAISL
ncbi:hypothetical protein EIP91_003953 [Steccherinum ochraceum]|uniref:NAD-dependent epimerase/dehydratase domain-containing protein n=1 Tax=Steccherinum ochraceum TaxID=92696 RepID=A0A4R0S221_9APHY|nr:hypothetical protein EIP91_003953 [Steccherinum ochraceum]